MSTFLKLVQDLHREVGAAGSAPTAVTNQFGESSRMVNWIIAADQYVQLLWHNWKFLYGEYTGVTVTSVVTLIKPSDHHYWDFDTFKIDGENLEAVEYFAIKEEVLTTIEAKPSRVIVMPDNSLKFDPIPDTAYTITADYYKRPTELAANTDISAIPTEYHNVILGRAVMLYGNHEDAAEAKTQGKEIYSEFLSRLQDHQLPSEKSSQYNSTGNNIEVIAG